jgi:hypothetical protein
MSDLNEIVYVVYEEARTQEGYCVACYEKFKYSGVARSVSKAEEIREKLAKESMVIYDEPESLLQEYLDTYKIKEVRLSDVIKRGVDNMSGLLLEL